MALNAPAPEGHFISSLRGAGPPQEREWAQRDGEAGGGAYGTPRGGRAPRPGWNVRTASRSPAPSSSGRRTARGQRQAAERLSRGAASTGRGTTPRRAAGSVAAVRLRYEEALAELQQRLEDAQAEAETFKAHAAMWASWQAQRTRARRAIGSWWRQAARAGGAAEGGAERTGEQVAGEECAAPAAFGSPEGGSPVVAGAAAAAKVARRASVAAIFARRLSNRPEELMSALSAVAVAAEDTGSEELLEALDNAACVAEDLAAQVAEAEAEAEAAETEAHAAIEQEAQGRAPASGSAPLGTYASPPRVAAATSPLAASVANASSSPFASSPAPVAASTADASSSPFAFSPAPVASSTTNASSSPFAFSPAPVAASTADASSSPFAFSPTAGASPEEGQTPSVDADAVAAARAQIATVAGDRLTALIEELANEPDEVTEDAARTLTESAASGFAVATAAAKFKAVVAPRAEAAEERMAACIEELSRLPKERRTYAAGVLSMVAAAKFKVAKRAPAELVGEKIAGFLDALANEPGEVASGAAKMLALAAEDGFSGAVVATAAIDSFRSNAARARAADARMASFVAELASEPEGQRVAAARVLAAVAAAKFKLQASSLVATAATSPATASTADASSSSFALSPAAGAPSEGAATPRISFAEGAVRSSSPSSTPSSPPTASEDTAAVSHAPRLGRSKSMGAVEGRLRRSSSRLGPAAALIMETLAQSESPSTEQGGVAPAGLRSSLRAERVLRALEGALVRTNTIIVEAAEGGLESELFMLREKSTVLQQELEVVRGRMGGGEAMTAQWRTRAEEAEDRLLRAGTSQEMANAQLQARAAEARARASSAKAARAEAAAEEYRAECAILRDMVARVKEQLLSAQGHTRSQLEGAASAVCDLQSALLEGHGKADMEEAVLRSLMASGG